MPILTLVTSRPQKDFDLSLFDSCPDITIENREVLDDRAARWHLPTPASKETLDYIRDNHAIDVIQTDTTPIKLFIADMDATIVQGETLDEIATQAGIGEKVSEITARAMRGELDFEQALSERVALLTGQPSSLIDDVINDMTYNKGARELLAALKSKGVYCVLVSGGFLPFTSKVAKDLGFDAHFGNDLIIKNSVLTGKVVRPILDKHFKLQKLTDLKVEMGLQPNEIMAIGDGANDLPMLQAAGFGVGYYGKPLLRESLSNHICHTDLSALTYTL